MREYLRELEEEHAKAEVQVNNARKEALRGKEKADNAQRNLKQKQQELAQLRKSKPTSADIESTNQKIQELLAKQARSAERLAALERRLAGAAVELSEEDLLKKINPGSFFTREACEKARQDLRSLTAERDELNTHHTYLTSSQIKREEEIRIQELYKAKALFGAGADLLNLYTGNMANLDNLVKKGLMSAKAAKELKIRYAALKAAVSGYYLTTAPDRAEQNKQVLKSTGNVLKLTNEILANPSLPDPIKKDLAARSKLCSLIVMSVEIIVKQQDKKPGSGTQSAFTQDDLMSYLGIIGVFHPLTASAGAAFSFDLRARKYMDAQDQIKRVKRMSESNAYAGEYMTGLILQNNRNLESARRTIDACNLK